MRRLVAPLLALGSALLFSALVWPTDRMVVESPGGAVTPLLDIWLWGRVRPLTELSVTSVDGSLAALAALTASALLAVVGAVVWRRVSRVSAGGWRWSAAAAAAVGAALVATTVAVGRGGAEFGWVSPGGPPTFTRTLVGAFPALTLAVWVVALVLMLVLLRRRRGPDDGVAQPPAS